MFVHEAAWITESVACHAPYARSLIDVGSESPAYRIETQPHIAKMYAGLNEQGIAVTTLDFDPAFEPDIVCDITQPLEPGEHGPYDVVLASNVLEHIPTDRLKTTINNLFHLATNDGLVVVTVPFNLPEHGHPIDTMLRPTPEELVELVGREALVSCMWTEPAHYKEPYVSNPTLSPLPVVTGALFKA
jgi:hypothetical protein